MTQKGFKLKGDNTDWLGIKACITSHLSNITSEQPKLNILILGAGGTARAACYTATTLSNVGFIGIWNRTVEKAENLATEFGINVARLDEKSWDIVISTIPGEGQKDVKNASEMFAKPGAGIFIELAYKPRYTHLFQNAAEKGWHCVEGAEILIGQGLEQFKIWTGRVPPAKVMREATMKEVLSRQ